MKRIIKIISLFLTLLLPLTTCFGCSCGEGNSTQTTPEVETMSFIDNQQTNYCIVVPSAPQGSEVTGANLLRDTLFSSSGCEVSIVSDDAFDTNSTLNYISLGKTTLYSNSGFNIDQKSLNGDGFAVKSKNKNIYVIAGTKQNSYIYAVQSILNDLVNYESYSYDEIVYDSKSVIDIPVYDKIEKPTFKFRTMYNADVMSAKESSEYRLAIRDDDLIFTSCGNGHTIFNLLPPSKFYEKNPSWYTGNARDDQVCWTNEGLIEQLKIQVIEEVKNSPSSTHLMIGQNDFSKWCNCEGCAASFQKYGTHSAAVVKVMNIMQETVDEYLAVNQPGREVSVTMFAYVNTEKPPVKLNSKGKYEPIDSDIILNDNVTVRIAPINTNYARTFYDIANEGYAKVFKGWQAIAKNIIVWNYNTNFNNYFVPFCNFNVIQDNYKFFEECNVTGVMEQGAHDSIQIGFIKFKNYVSAKLMWDNTLDYQELTNNFFDNYYKMGSSYMKKYFDEYRDWYNILEKENSLITGSIYTNYKAEAFPLNLLDRWEGYVDEAKKQIEFLKDFDYSLYTKIYDRMDIETLFFDYFRIFEYDKSFSKSELSEMKTKFKTKCEKYGLTKLSETRTLASAYEGWGL